MRNLKLILLTLSLWGSIASCKSIIQDQIPNQITTELTDCGSYYVKTNGTIIGYAVKPFVVKIDRAKEITEFEKKLKMQYKNKFKNDYRAYAFTTDIVGDTILMTSFLSLNQVENIPDWKCELLDIDAYPKNSEWIDYNCSKNRFKLPGDPD